MLEEPISVVMYGANFYILQILLIKSGFSFDYGPQQAMWLFQKYKPKA